MANRHAKGHYKPFKKKSFVTGRKRKQRLKTFKTVKAAEEYAKKLGYKKYKLVNLKSVESKDKKIEVRVLE